MIRILIKSVRVSVSAVLASLMVAATWSNSNTLQVAEAAPGNQLTAQGSPPVPTPKRAVSPARALQSPTGGANVTVNVDRTNPIGVSHLGTGVTLTGDAPDPWNDAGAVTSAKQLMRASTGYANQHIMGWGVGNPEPYPGVFIWNDLDRRVQLMRDTGTTPVLTIAAAPDWMKGGQPGAYDLNALDVAPLPQHYDDFAELARQVARRYPDVRYYQVWNEFKGFWNGPLNRWDYESYTTLYNKVYDSLKSVNSGVQVGGPYVSITSQGNVSTMSNNSGICGAYGCIDQRPLDVITYWLAHKHGADFITLDGCCGSWDGVYTTDEFTQLQKAVDTVTWVKSRTSLPFWWAEWQVTRYGGPTGQEYHWDWYDPNFQNALLTSALLKFALLGVTSELLWRPQGRAPVAYQGDQESLWTDTKYSGGGQPFPFYYAAANFKQYFGEGTPLYATSSSSPDVDVLASASHVLLVNKTQGDISVSVNGTTVPLPAHQVRVL